MFVCMYVCIWFFLFECGWFVYLLLLPWKFWIFGFNLTFVALGLFVALWLNVLTVVFIYDLWIWLCGLLFWVFVFDMNCCIALIDVWALNLCLLFGWFDLGLLCGFLFGGLCLSYLLILLLLDYFNLFGLILEYLLVDCFVLFEFVFCCFGFDSLWGCLVICWFGLEVGFPVAFLVIVLMC